MIIDTLLYLQLAAVNNQNLQKCYALLGVGYAIIVVNLITLSYYNIIIAYPVIFMLKSLSAVLPWQECNNPWNTVNCLEVKLKMLYFDESIIK